MSYEPTYEIQGAHEDERGSLTELFRGYQAIQANLTSSRRGVIRGMHFATTGPGCMSYPRQAKLITCLEGVIQDVAVSIVYGSSNFGKVYSRILDTPAANFYIPAGYAHGFLTLSETSLVLYHLNSRHDAETEFSINPLDPEMGIEWESLPVPLVLSERDSAAPGFREMLYSGRLPVENR